MSDTPRTDARLIEMYRADVKVIVTDTVHSDFARTLERELADAQKENLELRERALKFEGKWFTEHTWANELLDKSDRLSAELAAAQARIAELEVAKFKSEIVRDQAVKSESEIVAMLVSANKRIAKLSANQCEKEPSMWIGADGTGWAFKPKYHDTEPLYRKATHDLDPPNGPQGQALLHAA